jgi:acyl-CoA thioesterase-1
MSISALGRAGLRGCGWAMLLCVVACRAAAKEPPLPPAPMQTEPVPTAALGPKVAFLGDSISAGLHLAADQAFPAVLQRKLAEHGLTFDLVNAGVSGDTSAGGLRRVDWLLKQHPRVIVIELGGNDGLRGIPVAVTEQNLRAIVTKIRQAGAAVLLLGMRIPPSVGVAYAEQFAAIYPRLATELGVAFVPFFMEGVAGVPELNLEDGIHPTAAGHERIAAGLVEPLQKLLR